MDGVFYNAGQSCCAVERIYIHNSLIDEFVKKACEDEHEEVIANRQARFHNLIGDMADDEIEEVEANQEFVN